MQLSAGRARGWLSLCLWVALCVPGIQAADHVDSPRTNALANRDLDITDVYVFRSPATRTNAVIAVNHQSIFNPAGGIAIASGTLFASDGVYQTFVDRNGDLVPDLTITTRFAGAGPVQIFSVEGLTPAPITGNVTPLGSSPLIVQREGITVFCGARDDPFFFDLAAFNDFVFNGPYIPSAGIRRPGNGAPTNFFRGNVASIVLELPVTMLTGGPNADTGTVKIWSKTFRNQ